LHEFVDRLAALTIIMILRGRAMEATKEAMSVCPSIDLPLARPLTNFSTTPPRCRHGAVCKPKPSNRGWPCSTPGFSPMTARPMSPISLFFDFPFVFLLYLELLQ
jgi:hypothetical protein